MRTLRFVVEDQTLKQDPHCDFSGLVPGTEDYLQVSFSFSSVWIGYGKTVIFRSMLGKVYSQTELKDGKTCVVPIDALKKRAFKMQIVGQRGKQKILTNKLVVNQTGGKE